MKPSKFQIFQKSLKIVKNWYMIPLIYYGFVKSEYCVLNLKSGHKIKIRVKSTDLQVFTNVWLNEEYKFSGFNINDNDTIIDIGAHIGLFAIFASQFSKGGKILSFEPVSSNYKLLLENIELNKQDMVVVKSHFANRLIAPPLEPLFSLSKWSKKFETILLKNQIQ